MKHLKTLAIVASFIMLATTANAQNILLDNSTNKTNLIASDDEPTIFSIRIITDHDFAAAYSVKDYVGNSTTAPCSDLKSNGVFTGTPNYRGDPNFSNSTIDYPSEPLLRNYGPAATCIKTDITINGNNYSTGNILLVWDESSKSYTSAIPNKIDIDVSNADKKAN